MSLGHAFTLFVWILCSIEVVADRVKISFHGPDEIDTVGRLAEDQEAYENEMLGLVKAPFDTATQQAILDFERSLEDGNLVEVEEAAAEVQKDLEVWDKTTEHL